jgi:hypothetical protein
MRVRFRDALLIYCSNLPELNSSMLSQSELPIPGRCLSEEEIRLLNPNILSILCYINVPIKKAGWNEKSFD